MAPRCDGPVSPPPATRSSVKRRRRGLRLCIVGCASRHAFPPLRRARALLKGEHLSLHLEGDCEDGDRGLLACARVYGA